MTHTDQRNWTRPVDRPTRVQLWFTARRLRDDVLCPSSGYTGHWPDAVTERQTIWGEPQCVSL